MARKAKKALENVEKARAEADRKLNETLTQLSQMEKAYRNAESDLKSLERQAFKAVEA